MRLSGLVIVGARFRTADLSLAWTDLSRCRRDRTRHRYRARSSLRTHSLDAFTHMSDIGLPAVRPHDLDLCFRIGGAGASLSLLHLFFHCPPPSGMRATAQVCITLQTFLVRHLSACNRLHRLSGLISRIFETEARHLPYATFSDYKSFSKVIILSDNGPETSQAGPQETGYLHLTDASVSGDLGLAQAIDEP